MNKKLHTAQNLPNIYDNIKDVFLQRHAKKCSIEFFLEQAFYELNRNGEFLPNWHIRAIAKLLQEVKNGNAKRIIIALPPRYMKSHIVTVSFTAWILGQMPNKKIITASYNQQLSNNFLSQVKILLNANWYKYFFKNTKLAKTSGLKNKIVTTQNGFRFSTSISGTLTGEGGDILIVDDPHKPLDILNARARKRVHSWFENTLSSRLNNKKEGVIIVIMQRLHEDDLVGYLLSKPNFKQWSVLNLDLISTEDKIIKINDFEYFRQKNEPLHEERQNKAEIEMLRQDVGEDVFNSQYQQNPRSQDGGIIKKAWISDYQESCDNIKCVDDLFEKIYFISIDSAIKSSTTNDYTAISIWYCLVQKNSVESFSQQVIDNNVAEKLHANDKIAMRHKIYLQDVVNQRLTYPQIIVLICQLINKYNPQGIIIEDAASGSQLIQQLKNVVAVPIFGKVPTRGKQIRLTFASLFFEKRLIFVNTKMTEYYTTVNQLTNFPSVKHDDICDSISMFVNWFYDFYEPTIIESRKPRKLQSFALRGL